MSKDEPRTDINLMHEESGRKIAENGDKGKVVNVVQSLGTPTDTPEIEEGAIRTTLATGGAPLDVNIITPDNLSTTDKQDEQTVSSWRN